MHSRFAAILLLAALGVMSAPATFAQSKVGYIDSEAILGQMTEYTQVQQQIDRMAQDWQAELERRQEEVDALFQEYQARELLYTNEERQRRREEILDAEQEVERLRIQYFGPEGQLFQQQESLIRPIQERVLEAVERVAEQGGYDYVFDKDGGGFLFLYARPNLDLSQDVLEELGIDVESAARGEN